MNRIHIARNRQSLGQFSPEEVAQGLASGELLLTDLAWREPMDDMEAAFGIYRSSAGGRFADSAGPSGGIA